MGLATLGWMIEFRMRRAVVEVALIGALYLVYSAIRNRLPLNVTAARDNAEKILDVERWLGIDWELPANLWAASNHALAVGANYYYAICHFVFTVGLLVWVFIRRHDLYAWARNALLFTTVLALIGFALYPMAPPRLLSGQGYIDTFVAFGTWGSLSQGSLSELTNQYAAMPSLHVGWAVWCAWVVVRLTSRVWLRVVAVLHPVLTSIVVVVTANHFVLDIVGGIAAVVGGFLLAALVARLAEQCVAERAVRQEAERVTIEAADHEQLEAAGANFAERRSLHA